MSTASPIASVMTATMGRGDWVKSITSVLDQDCRDFEVILIIDNPDFSSDDLARLEADHAHLQVIRNAVNMGLTRSMNIAARHAKGRILVRHDDDDISLPHRIEALVERMERDNLDITASYARAHNEGEEQSWIQKSPLDDREIKAALEQKNCLIHPTIAIRREAFDKLGGYDETFRYAQDYALYLKAKRLGLRFGCIDQPLVKRVYGRDSITVAHRKTQMLYSLSAKILHNAEQGSLSRIPLILGSFIMKFATPMAVRKLSRRLLARKGMT